MMQDNFPYTVSIVNKAFTAEELKQLWHSVGWTDGSARDEKSLHRLQEAVSNSSFVASTYCGARLVGLLAAIDDTYNAYITYCVVDADFQGRGIGKWMLELFCGHFAGYWWHVSTHHAAGFYKKFGFEGGMCGMSRQEGRKP